MRRFVVATAVCLAMAGPPGTASAGVPVRTTEARLRAIGVTPAESGMPRQEADRGLATPTANNCGPKIIGASDRLRVARIQDDFYRIKGRYRDGPYVSNEVVLYKRGGADAYLADLRRAARCVFRSPDGTMTRRLAPTPAAYLPGSVLLFVDIKYSDGGRDHGAVLAQRRGNVVSMLYIYAGLSDRRLDPLLKRLPPIQKAKLLRLAATVPVPTP